MTARQRQAAGGGDVDKSQVPTEIQISFLMFLSFCFSLFSPLFCWIWGSRRLLKGLGSLGLPTATDRFRLGRENGRRVWVLFLETMKVGDELVQPELVQGIRLCKDSGIWC